MTSVPSSSTHIYHRLIPNLSCPKYPYNTQKSRRGIVDRTNAESICYRVYISLFPWVKSSEIQAQDCTPRQRRYTISIKMNICRACYGLGIQNHRDPSVFNNLKVSRCSFSQIYPMLQNALSWPGRDLDIKRSFIEGVPCVVNAFLPPRPMLSPAEAPM